MPSTKLKPIYLANSVGELNKKINLNSQSLSTHNVRMKCNSAGKLLSKAVSCKEEGDEEMAYVLYMKYSNLVQNIRITPEFRKDKNFVEAYIGKNNIVQAIEQAEKLAKSLDRRYKLLEEENEVKRKLEEEEMMDVLEEKTKSLLIAEEDSRINETTLESNDSDNIVDFEDSIKCLQLYQMICENVKSLLIIDARSEEEYNLSHINHPSCFNIPEDILTPGSTGLSLEKQLSRTALQFWERRDKVDFIILYDWVSTVEDMQPALQFLRKAMTVWDVRVELKHPPFILEGGFESWYFHYPMLMSNHKQVKVPKNLKKDDKSEVSLNFDYPSLDDGFINPPTSSMMSHYNDISELNNTSTSFPRYDRSMKPSIESFSSSSTLNREISNVSSDDSTIANSSSLKSKSSVGQVSVTESQKFPIVNRSLKPSESEKAINKENVTSSTQMLEKIIAEETKVANESLSIEKQRYEKELQFDRIALQREKEAEEGMRMELQKKEEQLLEKIRLLELDKKQKEDEEFKLRDENEKIKIKLESTVKQQGDAYKKLLEEKEVLLLKHSERIKLERETERIRQERKIKERERERKQDGPLSSQTTVKSNPSCAKPQIIEQTKTKPDLPAGDSYYTKLKDEPSAVDNQLAPRRASLTRSHSSPNIAQMITSDDEEKVTSLNQIPQVDRTIKPFTKTDRKTSHVCQQPDEYRMARMRNLMPLYGNQGRALTGLRNLGNTCFMNSIIQCLAQTTYLATFFITGNYRKHINRVNPLGHHGELAEEFAVVIRALWAGQYRSIVPRDFKNTVSKYHRMFEGNDQQDSQEFLVFLMDGLHEDLNEVKVRPQQHRQLDNDNLPVAEAAEKAWEAHMELNRSLIVSLFQGQYKSTVKCLHCGKQSITFDTFMYLSLPIPANSSRCSLIDCLRLFLKEEKMTGASKWFCPKCGERREADKKMDIWKLPTVLLIHLKRFSYEGMWRRKLQTAVDFPLLGLDLKSYVLDPKKRPSEYSLYAVSNHYGTMEGGHYTAFCKNSEYDKWYKFDDHEVSEMSSSDVKSPAAYILFYTSMNLPVPIVPGEWS